MNQLVSLALATTLALSVPLTMLLTVAFNRLSYRLRLLGEDVHKPDRPLVPRIGGLGFVTGYAVVTTTSMYLVGSQTGLLVLVLVPLVACTIGLIEDLRELNPLLKPLILITPGVLVVLLGLYDPYPVLPFIGQVRLTIVYPILVLVAYTVVCNAVNSLDVLNGSLVLTSIPVLSVIAALSYVKGNLEATVSAASMALCLAGFYRYNRFPARSFSGNAGSIMVGAVITSLAIYSKLELVAIAALMPHIMNEFHLLSSVGGIKSGKLLRQRPVRITDGMIAASTDPNAPLTLVRMLTLDRPLSEPSITLRLGLLAAFSSALAVVTYVITVM